MKKLLVAVLLSGFAMSASAGLSKSCETYFAEIDSFVSAVPAAQQAMMKQQYDANNNYLLCQKLHKSKLAPKQLNN